MPESIIAALEETLVSARYLREALETAEGHMHGLIAHLKEHRDPVATTREFAHAATRTAVAAQLEEYVRDRHRLRVLFVQRCVEDGMTMTEYAELYGISRQQVARLLKSPTCDRD